MSETQMVIGEVTDPEEIARFRERRRHYDRNDEEFRRHIPRVYREHRGKVVIVAGQELHVSDTAEEAWAWAREHHPDDRAPLIRHIPEEKGWRVCAVQQALG